MNLCNRCMKLLIWEKEECNCLGFDLFDPDHDFRGTVYGRTMREAAISYVRRRDEIHAEISDVSRIEVREEGKGDWVSCEVLGEVVTEYRCEFAPRKPR